MSVKKYSRNSRNLRYSKTEGEPFMKPKPGRPRTKGHPRRQVFTDC